MYVQREFHDLHTGDSFSFSEGGPVHLVEDGNFLDRSNEQEHRLVMYQSTDGWHGHLANHETVWLVTD